MARNKKSALAEQITRLRTERGLTRYALSKALGLSPEAVYNLESGKVASPAWSTIQALAQFFGVSTEDFKDSGEKVSS